MKTTLVAVSGMSPAIITETLWALACEAPPVVPDEVLIITTSKGESDIRRDLLSRQENWGNTTVWEALRTKIFDLADLPERSSALQLSIRVIDLPNPDTGVREPAEDLRERSHNDEAADFILRIVSSLAEASDTRLIASIAGGRKTMGALLYAAMTLVGRETDRVTHVLVSPPFDTCRGFFYPEQPVQSLDAFDPSTRTTLSLTASNARIELGDIRFVPLRNGFAELAQPKLSFPGLVYRYSVELKSKRTSTPKIVLDPETSTLVVDGKAVGLTGRELLVSAFLYQRLRSGIAACRDSATAAPLFIEFASKLDRKDPVFKHRDPARAVDASDLTKGLSSLRKKLGDHGLGHTIGYLVPPRSRVGFEASLA